MMFRKKSIVIALITIFFVNTTVVYGNMTTKSKTLIVYESTNEFGYIENEVSHLKQLIHAFCKVVDTININDYQSKIVNKYDYVLVTNVEEINNKYFLDDLTNFNNRIYWIGNKIENYLDYSKKYNLNYEGKNKNIIKLNYNGEDTLVEGVKFYNIIKPSKETKVLASMSDGYNSYPYVLNEKNLFYISKYSIGENFIFEDSLNDFYNITSFKEEEIFVRIEDVHPFRDNKELREIADYLYSKDIPYIIALIPTFLDNKTGHINTLEPNSDFVETIKYMQDKGGSVILHGYTHQMGKEEISGEGYEFWDMKNNTPIENIDVYVKDRVLSGLRLCIENNIYPLGFEAPHYAMDSSGYKEIKKYFSTYIGQYQNNDENFSTSTFPYTIENSTLFNLFIPENMGYVDEENKFSVEEIKANYNKLSVVRGHTGGFFYHPYLGIDKLKEIIEFLEDKDVNFLDLKSNYNYVKIDDINITSQDGIIKCSYDKSKAIIKNDNASEQNQIFRNINDIVINFVIIVLIIFIIIFIFFKKINNDKFTRR